jgi:hypothetical protein
MSEDTAHSITIPLTPLTTVTDTHHGASVELSESLMRAVEIWQNLKDDQVAAKVGECIQQRINGLRR